MYALLALSITTTPALHPKQEPNLTVRLYQRYRDLTSAVPDFYVIVDKTYWSPTNVMISVNVFPKL